MFLNTFCDVKYPIYIYMIYMYINIMTDLPQLFIGELSRFLECS